MFRNRSFKVLGNLILLAFFCIGQVSAAPNNGAFERERISSSPDSLTSINHNSGVNTQGGTNLALGKSATASSVQGGNVASRVTDGLTSTAWSSTFAEPAWIYIDLGSPQPIQQVILIWESAYGLEYQIEGSNNATTWTLLAQEFHGDGGTDYLSVSGTWRYFRMYGTQRGTGWGFSIFEFQIFDIAQPVPPTEPYIPSLPSKPTSQILFSDDFNSGNTSQWQIGRGVWQITNGALTSSFPCSGGSPYMITAGDTTWTNYQLTVDIRRVAGYDPGGILIRNSASGYYRVDIMPSLPYGGAVRITKSTTGASVQKSWPFNANILYKMVIDVEGPIIDVYVVDVAQNAQLLLSYTDTNAPFLAGNIGFLMTAGAVCPTQVAFDNIYVRQIEPSYLVSGVVKKPNGDPISEVQITANGLGISTITKLNGSYTLGRFVSGTFSVTPTKDGYAFSPSFRSVNVPPDAINQDFSVVTYSISGHVVDGSLNGMADVSISDGAGHTVTTDGSGNYSLSGLDAGAYTLTASKSGNTFSPASRTVTVPPSATNQDFTLPFLDLPFQYTNFSEAAKGGNSGGYVNSWFDHTNPGNINADNNLTTWFGPYTGGTYISRSNCNTPPGGLGISCYNGHDGIDFKHVTDEILAAAPGIVWKKGYDSTGFGNYLYIDHQNCYASFYAHLKNIPTLQVGDPIIDRQKVGIMGNTGGGSIGIHLHFGLYYDPTCDGDFTDRIVVDPYGWNGTGIDPWMAGTSRYLWKYPYDFAQQSITNSGGSASIPSGNVAVNVPAGAVSSTVTLELWDSPPVAGASASLRSTGNSFLMRILEWLTGGSSPIRTANASANSFDLPVTVTVHYDPSTMPHLDTNQLTINQWDDVALAWIALPTTLDTVNQEASAQTSQPGNFDLQAPLVCPADTLEPNDNYDGARVVLTDGTQVSNLFDIATDEDWFRFDAVAGTQYDIQTSNLATGVDTTLELYDTDGVTLLVSNDNGGGGNASSLNWQAPQDGVYFARVVQASGSSFGCGSTYNFAVTGNNTLTVVSDHGTVAKNPDQATYHEGDVVQLTATPATGWSFANWTGDLSSSINPDSITIHGNTSVTANYIQNEYTLTITSAHGTVAKNPSQATYHEGDVVQLTVTPSAGWSFVNWTVGLTGSTNPASITIHGNTSVTANFNQIPTDISLTNSSVIENKVIGTTVGTLSTVDSETGDTHTYSFCGGADDASFALVGDAINTAAVFDYETKNSYSICIRTNDGHGIYDEIFTISILNVPGLELVSPQNGSSLKYNRPAFDWNDYAGAIGYQIQVSKSAGFGTTLINVTVNGAANSQYTATKNLPAKTLLYWRVRAKLSATKYSAWSSVFTFTTANPPSVPVLVSPANGALLTNLTPTLDWSDSTVPAGTTFSHYQLQLDDNSDFLSTILDTNLGVSTLAMGPLNSNMRYYWRVRAWNTNGDYSAWSAVRSFREAILAPTLLSPIGGATVGSLKPLFDWSDVIGATGYTIQVSLSSNFGTLTINVSINTPTSQYMHSSKLQAGKLYYWRVRANGPNGPSVWSLVATFYTP